MARGPGVSAPSINTLLSTFVPPKDSLCNITNNSLVHVVGRLLGFRAWGASAFSPAQCGPREPFQVAFCTRVTGGFLQTRCAGYTRLKTHTRGSQWLRPTPAGVVIPTGILVHVASLVKQYQRSYHGGANCLGVLYGGDEPGFLISAAVAGDTLFFTNSPTVAARRCFDHLRNADTFAQHTLSNALLEAQELNLAKRSSKGSPGRRDLPPLKPIKERQSAMSYAPR